MSRPARATRRASTFISRSATRRGAPQQRLDARQQLGERERLHEVVVAAGAQALDSVVDRAQRAQHQHRRGDSVLAQRLHHREAVHVGQHAVDDQQVRAGLPRRGEAIAAVGAVLHAVAGFAQARHHVAGRLDVVFHQQDLHQPSIPQPGIARGGYRLSILR
jgi:hypothetical protein